MSYDTTGSMVGATVGDPSDERWSALIDETDLVKGASLIGRSAMVLASLADLPDVPQSYTHEYIVQGHRPGITTGGGRFYWDGAVARNRHNGGTIISPTVPAYTAQTGLAGYLDGSGETEPSAFGCFVRKIEGHGIRLEWFGWLPGELATAPAQKLLQQTRSNEGSAAHIGYTAMFPPATVRSGPLVIGSDQIIAGTSRTVILQEPGTVTMDVQPFISMAGQSNVFIFGNGMQINGQKNEARSGEGRYGLFIYGSKKVLVQDLTINAFSGDGLAVTGDAGRPSEDVRIDRVLCNFNGRNGFSVINARRATLLNCRATNTNTNGLGASANGPWAAFDIEPNEGSGYFIEDINLIGCSSEGNAGNGLQFTIPNTDSPVSVRVSGFQSRRDGSATQYGAKNGGVGFIYGGGVSPKNTMSGLIQLVGIVVDEPFGSAMRFRNWSARNAPVLIRDVTIRNVNFGVATGNINRCGVWQDSSDSMEVIEPKGNFEVDGLTVFDDNQQLIRPVWTMGIVAAPTIAKVRNVYVNRHGYPAVLPLRTKVQGGVGWSELPMVSLSSSSAIAGTDYVGQMVELTGSGGFVLPEAALASGCVFRIRNGSSGSINVTALAGGITGSTYGSYTNTGSSLTLNNGQYAELWSNGSTWVLK
ncbi:right-handed parallel beta-helix repeat-containing protein [Pseudomonas aeruginosa]|uniref:right-handed parallel beta-helix repeat-containing protein n=1 Tax=Pseudomonas aeruginosa TaxID=287 RepID=UPI0005BB403A|nr:right-handed parallel beta-helix repeat-containing protein [Pseudomonas aeruginosa]EMB4306746.1 right-handed parallel beta-helix repeat-containing protein [Pseudomonas aeruginosa]MCO1764308.1 right-handed parallel beta-helix repeat-containing protein [Pseudomonas aeruginosa]MCO2065830.1 right-handed parallel beta-helix repeat-containing protein [Pseudomonas aeruginosa]MCS7938826.1 right-handed parallel beta-helix repeat-containing protein [Pseudomonas aeruginosa]MCV4039065.1 right-handed pa